MEVCTDPAGGSVGVRGGVGASPQEYQSRLGQEKELDTNSGEGKGREGAGGGRAPGE